MKIAVIGGGINGIMSAWALAKDGQSVDLFEKNRLMGATSSASSKILHGGLRYLENFEFRLVSESLRERLWWMEQAPALAKPTPFIFPLYADSPRPRWKVRAGLTLYDGLAGARRLGWHQWYSREAAIELAPELKTKGLKGAFTFYDVLMDDLALGLWAAELAEQAGVAIHEQTPVERFDDNAGVTIRGHREQYDYVVNVAGPWAEALNEVSNFACHAQLDLVRGSHILLAEAWQRAFLLQVPGERRMCFVLPYKGKTLVGTTEVRQSLNDPIVCSEGEKSYLLNIRNHYFQGERDESSIESSFAGLRPLVRSHKDPSRASREYVIQKSKRVISVFGGKWTTSRALGQKVAAAIGHA